MVSINRVSSSTAAATTTPTLQQGASGAPVKTLQTLLQKAGFSPGGIDGDFGPKTDAAVRSFQQAKKLTVDGIVGPKTWAALKKATAPKPPPAAKPATPLLKKGANGPAVKDLQTKLKKAGFSPGPIDGDFGPMTETALKRYQSSRGLNPDGIASPKTWAKLNSNAPAVKPPAQPPTTGVARVSDAPSNEKIARLHPKIRAKAAEFFNKVERQLGIRLRMASGLRTFAEQTALYAQGRTKPGPIVTNAKAGESYHNYGVAFDIVEVRRDGSVNWNTKWDAIAKIGKSLGFEWGGDWTSFKDRPHFQMTFGRSTSQLLAMVKNGQTSGGYVNV